ncbi:MAG: biopolymer transporter ExbD [Myxococcota bacterium]|jgi:biopolymer transport protein ExbD|nr:biopolymer transporter ExbD [Myxococcota bacterium]
MATGEKIPDDINSLPDPASFVAPEDGYTRKRKKKREEDEGGPLNINSLMDIMTILLVFLLKSYSTNPVQLKQADDLMPPFSSSQIEPKESTAVTVTLNAIMVNDEPVLRVENGVVAEADRSSGGFLIDPLFSNLQEEVDIQKRIKKMNKQGEWDATMTIISDRHVPFSLLSQVMYTAGQAQFAKFRFVVVKKAS